MTSVKKGPRSASVCPAQSYLLPPLISPLREQPDGWRGFCFLRRMLPTARGPRVVFSTLFCADAQCWLLHLFSVWREERLLHDPSAALDAVHFLLLDDPSSRGFSQPHRWLLFILFLVLTLLLDSWCWNDSVLHVCLFSNYPHSLEDLMQSQSV